jgi:anti-sigma B factor antagonist
MLLQTSSRSVGDSLIVDCKGKIVFGDETAFLRHQVRDLLNEYRHIVLNLADVSYIDSAGVGTLVGLYTSAQSGGGEIALVGLAGKVKDVLQITKLVTVFETFAAPEEAIARFGRHAA